MLLFQLNQKGVNMTKEKRQTLNTEKRKVIGGVFQDHFESKSK